MSLLLSKLCHDSPSQSGSQHPSGGPHATEDLASMTYLTSLLQPPCSPFSHTGLCVVLQTGLTMEAALCLECSSPRELHGALPQLLQVSFLRCHPPSDAHPVHPTKTASLSLALPTPFPAFSIRIDHLLIQYQIYIFGLCLSSPIRL